MAEVKELQVGYRKTVSDGNYGNETHEARMTVTVAEGESGVDFLLALSLALEDHVNSRFRQSPNENIRYAIESPEERQERYNREAEEREAERERRRAERGARLAAEDADDDDSPF